MRQTKESNKRALGELWYTHQSIYNPFASSAHPPIVRDHANVHKIGSHFPVEADRYPWISRAVTVGLILQPLLEKKMVF